MANNTAPVFANVDPEIESTEQVLAIADGDITIHDAELDALNGGAGDYAGASITISRQGVANPEDYGWIDFTGASFTAGFSGLEYNGLVFAGISGGSGTATITFTSAQTPATTALVNEVIQRFMYANTSDNPPASIVVDYTFNDGNAGAQGTGGAGITTASMIVNITPVNDAPVLSGLDASATFTEKGIPQLIDADVNFSDPEDNFAGGVLRVSGTLLEDMLSIRNQGTGAGQIGLSGTNVSYEGTVIGTVAGGLGGAPLWIDFNANATSAGIDALIQNLTYASNSDDPTPSHTLSVRLWDSEGETTQDFSHPVFTETTGADNPFDGIHPGGENAPALVDLDSDGDSDLVVGVNGELRYFENTGSSYTPIFVERTGIANPFNGYTGSGSDIPGPTFGDLDHDGDADMVVGNNRGELQYFENTGTALAPAFIERTGASNPFNGVDVGDNARPVLVDLDQDGRLDLVAGSSNSTGLHFYRNDGTPSVPHFAEQPGADIPVNGAAASFFDVDHDGDLDAVIGDADGSLHYFENNSTLGTPDFVELTGAANPFNGVDVGSAARPALADINGDKAVDVVVGELDGNLNYFHSSAPLDHTIEINITAQNDAPAIALKGDLDIVTVNFTSRDAAVLLGDGAGGMTASSATGTGSTGNAFDIVTGDFNQDGKLDAVTANNADLSLLTGDGLGGFNLGTTIGVGLGGLYSVAAGDMNNDGKLDIVTASDSGTVGVLQNDGTGGFTAHIGLFGSGGTSTNDVAVGDIDDDGWLDIVTANGAVGSNNVSVLLNDHAGGFIASTFGVGGGSNPWRVALGDMDNDGNLDIVTANTYSNNVSVLLNDGTGHGFAATTTGLGGGVNPYGIALGDVDWNDTLDIVTANYDSNDVSVLRSLYGGGFLAHTESIGGGLNPHSVAIVRLDGDILPEIVTANYGSNDISVLINEIDGNFSDGVRIAVGATGPVSIAFGNFNSTQTLDEDGSLTFSQWDHNLIVASDVDAGSGNETVSLSVSHGVLSLGSTADLSVSGNGTGSVTITGTISAINNAFSGFGAYMFYEPTLNYNGTDELRINIDDLGNTGGTHLTASHLVPIVINAVNDAPTAQDGAATGNENTVIHGMLAATDIDGGALTYSRVAQAAHGSVTVNADGTFDYTPNTDYWGADSFTFKANDGFADSNSATVDLTVNGSATTAPSDLNGDGFSDILWRHSNGFVSEWQMDNARIDSNIGVGLPANQWRFLDTGDFNGDDRADLLWRHDNGQVVLWTMDGQQIVSNETVATIASSWHNEGAGDFNGDGRSDVLWHNDNGQVAIWTMNGAQITDNQLAGTVGPDQHVAAIFDAGGDGKTDILWRSTNGQVALWTMDGDNIASNNAVGNVGLEWNVAGSGDFDGDGRGDVLWRHDNGQVVLWTMDGPQITSNTSIASVGLDWQVETVGDYNGDQHADVIWRNDSGQVAMWEMDGAQILANHTVVYQDGFAAPVSFDWAVLSHHYDLL